MNNRENYLRALQFDGPEWIPVSAFILNAAWLKHREALESIVLDHPRLFGERKKGEINFDGILASHKEYERDGWGCLWRAVQPGIIGQVVGHPLLDWEALETIVPPDPLADDWEAIETRVQSEKERGLLTRGGGAYFMDTLIGMRGFENIMMDFATDPPELQRLIDMIMEYNLPAVNRWLDIGVDIMGFHSDIGTQRGPMMSREHFRKYLKPMYKSVFQTCRQRGALVEYSSDGNLLELVDDLIDCGVDCHDPQYRANTLEGIVKTYKGRMCAKVDLDQQYILPYGRPEQIDAHVREVVEAMYQPEGGFMIYAEIQPTYPLDNIEALCKALEKYCFTHE